MLSFSLEYFPAGAPRPFSLLGSAAPGPVSELPITRVDLSLRAPLMSQEPLPRNPPTFYSKKKKNCVSSPLSFYWSVPENNGLLYSADKVELSSRLFRIKGIPSLSFCPLFPLGLKPEGQRKPPMTHLFTNVC